MNWKSLALLSTSVAALSFSASAALAAPPTMGSIDVGITQWWDDYTYPGSNTYNDNWTSVSGWGRVNMPYSDRINIQVDLFGDGSLDRGYQDSNDSYGVGVGNFGAGVHLNWRDPHEGLLGVFGAVGRIWDYSGDGAPGFMGGMEGQYYCGNWTVAAQLGYMDSNGDYDFLQNGGFIRGLATYYASPRFKLTGGLAYIDGDAVVHYNGYTSETNATAWAWQAEGHYWFGRSVPVDLWVKYQGRQQETHYASDYVPRLTDNQLYVGFSWMFGGGNDYLTTDREGAGTDIPNYDWFRVIYD